MKLPRADLIAAGCLLTAAMLSMPRALQGFSRNNALAADSRFHLGVPPAK